MLTSTVALSLPNLIDVSPPDTPANSYSLEKQSQFCGIGTAKSNEYIKEYKIPTDCANPLAITTDTDGGCLVCLIKHWKNCKIYASIRVIH